MLIVVLFDFLRLDCVIVKLALVINVTRCVEDVCVLAMMLISW